MTQNAVLSHTPAHVQSVSSCRGRGRLGYRNSVLLSRVKGNEHLHSTTPPVTSSQLDLCYLSDSLKKICSMKCVCVVLTEHPL